MLMSFQIILFVILTVSGLGALGEEDKNLRDNMTALAIASMVAAVVTFVWL